MSRALYIFRIFFLTLGGIFLFALLFALTSGPFWIWYGLGTAKAGIRGNPDYIVVLGGSGIPSSSGLMRTWYAAEASSEYPDAQLIVAMPGDTSDSASSICRMVHELKIRGVTPERILLEDSGTNTRAQAMLIKELISKYEVQGTRYKRKYEAQSTNNPPIPISAECSEASDHRAQRDLQSAEQSEASDPLIVEQSETSHRLSEAKPLILLITSPEHLYRAVLTFEKAGFNHVDGLPTFGQDVESDISFSARRLGGRKWVPDVGESITLRYQFWTQLQYEILILREWTAITYYWLQGWI